MPTASTARRAPAGTARRLRSAPSESTETKRLPLEAHAFPRRHRGPLGGDSGEQAARPGLEGAS